MSMSSPMSMTVPVFIMPRRATVHVAVWSPCPSATYPYVSAVAVSPVARVIHVARTQWRPIASAPFIAIARAIPVFFYPYVLR